MQLEVRKALSLNGKAFIPGSKSQSIRGMFFALHAKGKSTLLNVLDSDDTRTAMRICQLLGAQVIFQDSSLTFINAGLLSTLADTIHTGHSGITTRFVLPALGLRENHAKPIYVNCAKQMQARPIQSLINALRSLGMHIEYLEQEGRLPVLVSGQLKGGKVEVDGTTSQYLSALLISLPRAQDDSVITVKNLHERSYVDMTCAWLNQQNIQYKHQQNKNKDIFFIEGRQSYQPFQASISGDFSSASYLLAAACFFPGELELYGLDVNDTQGDKQLIHLLQKMGADIVVDEKKIKIKGGQPLKGMAIDANSIPDLLPTLAVIATQAIGKTEIYNVKQARIKETDRIHSMTEGLRRMGAKIEERADGITIYPSYLRGAVVNGYDDHRTVMALAVSGLVAEGKTVISNGEAITKTYPEFVKTMQSLGANIKLSDGKNKQHIILIGFKHVGKTMIGKQLANVLQKNFIDLDDEIEKSYVKQHGTLLTCRQIMETHGDIFFRKQEQVILEKILQMPSAVIALGGGSVLDKDNQEKIKSHCLLHIVAPHGIVFERIMVSGRPAFFDAHEDPYESFIRLWKERSVIYKKLTAYTINNEASIDDAIVQAQAYLATNSTNRVKNDV